MKTSIRILLLVFFAALLNTALFAPFQNTDFEVYWNTAVRLLHGETIYSFSRDSTRCFKYPPWIAPAFIPLGFFPIAWAARIFRVLEVMAIGASFYYVRSFLKSSIWTAIALLLFWGFWMYNTQTGQISSFLVLGAVLGFYLLRKEKKVGVLLLFSSLSAKMIQLYALLGTPILQKKYWKAFASTAAVFLFLCLPSFWPYFPDIGKWLHDFHEASVSLGTDLSASNQGLAAFWIYLFGISPHQIQNHYLCSGVAALVLTILFFIFRKNLEPFERFFVLLAYAGILHPLAFSYNYVWVFPLVACVLDRRELRWISIPLILEITVISQKTVGQIPWLVFPGYRALATVLLSFLLLSKSGRKILPT